MNQQPTLAVMLSWPGWDVNWQAEQTRWAKTHPHSRIAHPILAFCQNGRISEMCKEILYYVVSQKKISGNVLAYFLQNSDDSDKLWYVILWITLPQRRLQWYSVSRISRLIWIVFSHYLVKLESRFVETVTLKNNKVDKCFFINIKHLINILWLKHRIKSGRIFFYTFAAL